MILLSGSSNRPLAQKIAKNLKLSLGKVEISKFPNGEKRIWVKENVKNKSVAIIQSFSEPVDEHIIEYTLMADACRHLGAKSIIAVIPWLGYSPQDKEFRKGEPISVHVISRIIESVGTTSILTVDIHSRESLKLFSIPAYEISALPLFASHLKKKNLTNHIVISLDKGAIEDSTKLAKDLSLPLAIFDKTRDRIGGQVTLKLKSGNVKGKTAIAIDDFVSTGSTRIQASDKLKKLGGRGYHDCITHALLASDSPQKLQSSQIDSILTTDTYHIPKNKLIPKLTTISIAPLLAQKLKQLVDEQPH